MTITELWLARHGESVANVAATRAERDGLEKIPIDLRDADVPLSATGVDQATALGVWLAEHRARIDTFWVSPYLRARQTLALALGDSGADTAAVIRVDDRLRDRELGILDLLTSVGAARLHPEEVERRRRLGKFYHRPPGGESWADVGLRLRSFLGDVTGAEGGSALVVAHDAVVMLFLYLLLPMEEVELLEFAGSHTVLNASLTHLVRTDAGWSLDSFSVVDHLTSEGAPVTVHPGTDDDEL